MRERLGRDEIKFIVTGLQIGGAKSGINFDSFKPEESDVWHPQEDVSHGHFVLVSTSCEKTN
jgi:hypothetical protein